MCPVGGSGGGGHQLGLASPALILIPGAATPGAGEGLGLEELAGFAESHQVYFRDGPHSATGLHLTRLTCAGPDSADPQA